MLYTMLLRAPMASAFLLIWAGLPALAQISYTVVDLGTLGGTTSAARAINSSGAVVGYSFLAGNTISHAFLYNGSMQDLGTLGGSASDAYGINAAGLVVGWALPSVGAQAPFLYDGTMHNLGTLGGMRGGLASGINSANQIVGNSGPPGSNSNSDPSHAFLYDGTMHDLGTFGGAFSGAEAINAAGLITGFAEYANGVQDAFLYDGSLHDLGNLGGNSNGLAINSAGVIVGTSCTSSQCLQTHGFLFDGSLHDLGTFGLGDAWGINDAGLVVGDSQMPNSQYHAILYSASAGAQDLNNLITPGSGWTLSEATAINNAGQIAGDGSVGGQVHAFRLDPIVPTTPAPASLVLTLTGILAVLWVAARSKWRLQRD